MVSPRIVVAAPGSGHGKTTVATGLMAALGERARVAGFKVGPDYIDPGYHALATGAPGRNLDPVLAGEHRVLGLFRHGSAGADLSVVEGVMGLFDGRLGGGVTPEAPAFGSTAHVAGLLDAPVVLVVDARGQSQSLAALLHGFRTYQPGARIAGVVLNQVGSRRHERVLTEAAESVGLSVLGTLPRTDGLEVPSRHLGLVTAAEHGAAAREAVASMSAVVRSNVDLDAVVGLARSAPEVAAPEWDATAEVGGPRSADAPVIALAGGGAFSFAYAEHAELLRAAGARVEVLDPLRDTELPAGTAGLVLPGGFPEQHARELTANEALRAGVARFARAGGPVHAECGGLLYLCRELDGHPMCGVLDARGTMSRRLVLGYRDAVALGDSPVHAAGERVTGHEFHRTLVEPAYGGEIGATAADPGSDIGAAWGWHGESGRVLEGFRGSGLHASYLHTHPAGTPASVRRFVERCARSAHGLGHGG